LRQRNEGSGDTTELVEKIELICQQSFWCVNADPAALFGNRALALPLTEQAAGGKHPDIGKAAEMLVGDVEINSGLMRPAAAVCEA
jgi:hypothetical protein